MTYYSRLEINDENLTTLLVNSQSDQRKVVSQMSHNGAFASSRQEYLNLQT